MRQTSTTSLNAARRTADLAALAGGEVVDVLVIGLGATGAGVALDAASRGLSVAAVDAHDLAFGTSRWSTKLVHGGLRYLARLEFGVAMESARERGILMERTAPHLTRAASMLLPIASYVDERRLRMHRAGIYAGDLLRLAAGTSAATLPRPRRISADRTRHLAPGLRDGVTGGYLHWDGQLEDDARLVVAIARTAAALGARVITRCRATDLAGDGAQVRDELTGDVFTVRARSVISAAGVWAGQLVDGVDLVPSRGSHVLLRASTLGVPRSAVVLPIPGDRARYISAVPQYVTPAADGLVLVGLTDEPADGPVPDVPAAPESDIAFILDVLNSYVRAPIRRDDVVGAFAGLRPLLRSSGHGSGVSETSDVSRRHALLTSRDGVVTIVGGKLTTYRKMAEDAVTAAVRRHGLRAGPSRTRRLPLVGAAPRAALAQLDAPERLIRRYGTEASAVATLGSQDSTLDQPIAPEVETIGAELVWALRHEGALDIDDLLDRRSRVGLVPTNRRAATTMAEAILAGHATGA